MNTNHKDDTQNMLKQDSRAGTEGKSLLVMIPAFNEARTIASVIEEIPRDIPGVRSVDVVVIDDGSADNTAELALAAGAEIVRHPHNKGVGAAITSGLAFALTKGADLVVNIDGDGQFNPKDITRLARPVIEDEADFATASRFSKKEYIPTMPWIKKKGNGWVAKIVNMCAGTDLKDVSCGFRAYSRDTLLKINLFSNFTYTHETIISMASKNVRIVEVPMKVRGVREFGKSRVASNVLKYGIQTFMIILRTLRDVKPLAFFGSVGFTSLLLGVLSGGFVFGHWMLTGQTSPYKSLLIGSAIGIIMGILFIVLALIADMLGRQRLLMDQLLYLYKRDASQK